MSGKRIIGYSILAVSLLVGTYIYFWALDFVNVNFGISLAQTVDQELGAWQFTVWVMACVLALIIVFNGMASTHHDLEPISSACYLGYTIVSMIIGCSAVTLNFPFDAFGTLGVQVTVDPAKLMALFGGGGGGGGPVIPPITIGISLLQLLMVSLSLVYAALRFLRALVKSRKETDGSETPKTKSPKTKSEAPKGKTPASPAPNKEAGSMDFMRNVRTG